MTTSAGGHPPVTRATRYALVGIAALALLALGHWLRAHVPGGASVAGDVWDYVLGVLPSALAAVAIPFVALGAWEDWRPARNPSEAWRRFLGVAAGAGVGLAGWELLQRVSRGLVFDPHDLGATAAGLAAAAVLFRAVTPAGRTAVGDPTPTANRPVVHVPPLDGD